MLKIQLFIVTFLLTFFAHWALAEINNCSLNLFQTVSLTQKDLDIPTLKAQLKKQVPIIFELSQSLTNLNEQILFQSILDDIISTTNEFLDSPDTNLYSLVFLQNVNLNFTKFLLAHLKLRAISTLNLNIAKEKLPSIPAQEKELFSFAIESVFQVYTAFFSNGPIKLEPLKKKIIDDFESLITILAKDLNLHKKQILQNSLITFLSKGLKSLSESFTDIQEINLKALINVYSKTISTLTIDSETSSSTVLNKHKSVFTILLSVLNSKEFKDYKFSKLSLNIFKELLQITLPPKALQKYLSTEDFILELINTERVLGINLLADYLILLYDLSVNTKNQLHKKVETALFPNQDSILSISQRVSHSLTNTYSAQDFSHFIEQIELLKQFLEFSKPEYIYSKNLRLDFSNEKLKIVEKSPDSKARHSTSVIQRLNQKLNSQFFSHFINYFFDWLQSDNLSDEVLDILFNIDEYNLDDLEPELLEKINNNISKRDFVIFASKSLVRETTRIKELHQAIVNCIQNRLARMNLLSVDIQTQISTFKRYRFFIDKYLIFQDAKTKRQDKQTLDMKILMLIMNTVVNPSKYEFVLTEQKLELFEVMIGIFNEDLKKSLVINRDPRSLIRALIKKDPEKAKECLLFYLSTLYAKNNLTHPKAPGKRTIPQNQNVLIENPYEKLTDRLFQNLMDSHN